MFLLLSILKLIWDQSGRLVTTLIFFIIVAMFMVIIASLKNLHQRKDLELIYNLFQLQGFKNNRIHSNETNNKTFNGELNNISNIIFFIETNENREVFSTKQLCAIESAAAHNPKYQVIVYSIRSEFDDSAFLYTFPNVKLVKLILLELFDDTPLFEWWISGVVFKSSFYLVHISDAIRLVLLYKYGGFYSDLDTISIKPFDPLMKYNGFGYLYENEASLGNGFIHFSARHSFLEFLIKKFVDNYNPKLWGNNGPTLIIDALKVYCQEENIFDYLMLNKEPNQTKSNCDNIVLFPEDYFYPFRYKTEVNVPFEKSKILNLTKIENSFSVHFYGKFTSKLQVKYKDHNLYEYLALKNCQYVYSRIKVYNGAFWN